MFKKTVAALALIGTSFASQANWQAGVGYVNLSDSPSGYDISLDGVYGSLGYKFKSSDNFYWVPELRLGTGIGDDTIDNYLAGSVLNTKLEMERYIALSLRGQYELDNGVYLYAAPSYANVEIKASGFGASLSEDEWEFGLGGGIGYNFSNNMAAELSYEQFDGVDVVSLAVKFDF
ncbi:outer membrane beta-barrel protein [Pseudoalteromonas sp. YIC-656]|uniref:outer membrane beta-barrel protein n=1 Tax=Pseudoalteromonas pernae TaxID=3118054 RepID=UPI0032428CB2